MGKEGGEFSSGWWHGWLCGLVAIEGGGVGRMLVTVVDVVAGWVVKSGCVN